MFGYGTSCSKNTKDIPVDACPTSNLQAVEFELDGRDKSERKLQLMKKRR
jgi:hypothetical protein